MNSLLHTYIHAIYFSISYNFLWGGVISFLMPPFTRAILSTMWQCVYIIFSTYSSSKILWQLSWTIIFRADAKKIFFSLFLVTDYLAWYTKKSKNPSQKMFSQNKNFPPLTKISWPLQRPKNINKKPFFSKISTI